MNKLLSLSVLATTLLLSSCSNAPQEEPLAKVIDRGLKASTEQALLMAKELEQQDGRLPKSIKDGKLETSDCYWWCSGFFPGELWYLYENNPTPELKKYAGLFTERLEKVQHVTDNHDVGFMLYCSYGNGYRLTQNPAYKDVLVTGAGSLSTRFNPMIKAIRSWDFTNNGKWQYPVIIDNMMNLELLFAATRLSGDSTFYKVAVSHVDRTMKEQYRPDGSCYHVVDYSMKDGSVRNRHTAQGYAHESAWSRGQAWGIYGLTLCYRETGDRKYLDQALKAVRFMFNHKNTPEDLVFYWDMDAPNIPNDYRDASAAACIASALYEISTVDVPEPQTYKAYADRIMESLASPTYRAELGTNGNFLLMHCVGSIPHNGEIDVPLNYADYYFLEALKRKRDIEQKGSKGC